MSIGEAYRKGSIAFMGVELLVAPGVLVPRLETELLGRTAVEIIRGFQAPARVIDMCCGCGNLVCSIARCVPTAQLWASDLTDECVEVARRNVRQLDLSGRVQVRQGDLFAGLRGLGLEGTADAVVCNPPYISRKRLGSYGAQLLDHEPREAFDGGPYGLSVHQRVLKDAPAFLRPGGVLLFEVGLGQARQVKSLFERTGTYDGIRLVVDAAGDARVALGRRSAP